MRWLFQAFRLPVTGTAILAGQVLHAAHRPDMPSLPDQDPSGVFGDPAARKVRLIMLGDSSITGPGVEPLDAIWSRVIATRLAPRYRMELISLASGGAKVRDVLDHQIPRALEMAPDLAVVSVGANDALRGTPLRRYEADLRRILEALAGATHAVGLSGIGDLGTVPRLPTLAAGIGRIRGRSFDRAIARAAAEFPNVVKNTTWGSEWRLFEEGDPGEIFAADQFHAAAPGQQVFADAFMPVMETILGLLPEDADRPDAVAAPLSRPARRESST